MSDIKKSLMNAAVAGERLQIIPNNVPSQYGDRQKQYFDAETLRFQKEMLKYASDFVQARVQGLEKGDPKGWATYNIRFSDMVRPTAAIQRRFDDFKMFMFESPHILYVPLGTKIEAMGSTWLVINPGNISGGSGTGVCRRCNATWNFYDFYGNVVKEPIIVENDRANASESTVAHKNSASGGQFLNRGYFNITCQYNENTAQINTNTRILLGKGAYRVTGYTEFEEEFTGDENSYRIIGFTARYEEPNDAIDDVANHVASGKSFSWEIKLTGPTSLATGQTAQFTVETTRNGEIVTSTPENPITYTWASSNEAAITVDQDGNVTAVAPGTADLRVTLDQNPSYHLSIPAEVTDTGDGVLFTCTVPGTVKPFTSVTLTAAYFQNGAETADAVHWVCSGADDGTYAITGQTDKSVTITGYGYSATPLTVTAKHGNDKSSVTFRLEGL